MFQPSESIPMGILCRGKHRSSGRNGRSMLPIIRVERSKRIARLAEAKRHAVGLTDCVVLFGAAPSTINKACLFSLSHSSRPKRGAAHQRCVNGAGACRIDTNEYLPAG